MQCFMIELLWDETISLPNDNPPALYWVLGRRVYTVCRPALLWLLVGMGLNGDLSTWRGCLQGLYRKGVTNKGHQKPSNHKVTSI